MIHTENLQFGITTAIIGILIVLAVLVVISLILSLFAVMNKAAGTPAQTVKKVKLPSKKAEEPVSEADDTELIAVIAAAAAASLNTSADKIVVRSIKKSTSWKHNTIERANNSN